MALSDRFQFPSRRPNQRQIILPYKTCLYLVLSCTFLSVIEPSIAHQKTQNHVTSLKTYQEKVPPTEREEQIFANLSRNSYSQSVFSRESNIIQEKDEVEVDLKYRRRLQDEIDFDSIFETTQNELMDIISGISAPSPSEVIVSSPTPVDDNGNKDNKEKNKNQKVKENKQKKTRPPTIDKANADKQGKTKQPTLPKERKTKEPTVPKERKTKEPTLPKEAKTKQPTLPKEAKTKQPTLPKEAKTKQPTLPKEAKTKQPTLPKEAKTKQPVLVDDKKDSPFLPGANFDDVDDLFSLTADTDSPTIISPSPSIIPSVLPTIESSSMPSLRPSYLPSLDPSTSPSHLPSMHPSQLPTNTPSSVPTSNPSLTPSESPTKKPSIHPTFSPSSYPTRIPSSPPSLNPSHIPSILPTASSSAFPTIHPSNAPSVLQKWEMDILPFTIFLDVSSLELDRRSLVDVTTSHMSIIFSQNIFFYQMQLTASRRRKLQISESYIFEFSGTVWFVGTATSTDIYGLTKQAFSGSQLTAYIDSLLQEGIDVANVSFQHSLDAADPQGSQAMQEGKTTNINIVKTYAIALAAALLTVIVAVMIYRRQGTVDPLYTEEEFSFDNNLEFEVIEPSSLNNGTNSTSFPETRSQQLKRIRYNSFSDDDNSSFECKSEKYASTLDSFNEEYLYNVDDALAVFTESNDKKEEHEHRSEQSRNIENTSDYKFQTNLSRANPSNKKSSNESDKIITGRLIEIPSSNDALSASTLSNNEIFRKRDDQNTASEYRDYLSEEHEFYSQDEQVGNHNSTDTRQMHGTGGTGKDVREILASYERNALSRVTNEPTSGDQQDNENDDTRGMFL